MAKIRVVRILEYAYPSLERALSDMAAWQVQGYFQAGEEGPVIRSTHLPIDVTEIGVDVDDPGTSDHG